MNMLDNILPVLSHITFYHLPIQQLKPYDGFILNIFVVITSFVFFRFFDISKLSLVGYYDRKDDSFSVLMDDIVAGVFAGILTAAIFSLL